MIFVVLGGFISLEIVIWITNLNERVVSVFIGWCSEFSQPLTRWGVDMDSRDRDEPRLVKLPKWLAIKAELHKK